MDKIQVTNEQIAQAKQIDLLSYLQQHDPQELVRISPHTFTTRTHDSLKISNGKWCWWAQNIGGKTALDYLIRVKSMRFTDAVLHLCNGQTAPIPTGIQEVKRRQFALPSAYADNSRVVNYLLSRGIEQKLIDHCIKEKRLYEDTRHNCVFVGYGDNKPKYAMLRTTIKDSTFMYEVEGSDKRYSFTISLNQNSDTVFVFESAVDLLSFISLGRVLDNKEQYNYLSLSGVYRPGNDEPHLPASLEHYLDENKHIRQVILCLDNDEAGRLAAQSIIKLLSRPYTIKDMPPTEGKDYNDYLMAYKNLRKQVKTRGAKSASNHIKEDLSK